MKNNQIIIGSVALAVVTGAIGFWGGTIYSQTKMVSSFAKRGEGRSMMQRQNGDTKMNGNRAAQADPDKMNPRNSAGEVTAKDNKSMTIKMSDGSSKIIILSDKTKYTTASESSLEEVKVGTKIASFGEVGTDGNMTATRIEINPNMMNVK